MRAGAGHSGFKVVEYDAFRRRVWILGQRCHHGATGTVVAAVACAGLIAEAIERNFLGRRAVCALAAATGGALMIHDWKDRPHWFERGRGSQT